jgi:hypothetical protein
MTDIKPKPLSNVLYLLVAVVCTVGNLYIGFIKPSKAFLGVIELLWAGMICGISFLEAWIKFRPKIVQENKFVAFEIGRTVFAALNLVEIILAGICATGNKRQDLLHMIPILLLVIQVTYLQPKLDLRAIEIIEHGLKQRPNLSKTQPLPHIMYVLCEAIKVICLVRIATNELVH